MAVEKSDWSKISTSDLITITQVFEQAVERDDGMFAIELNPTHWSRCFAIEVRDRARAPQARRISLDVAARR